MKNTKKIIKTASAITIPLTVICLIVDVILLALQLSNKIGVSLTDLVTFEIIPTFLLGAVSCIGLAVVKYMDSKGGNCYKEKEKGITVDIVKIKKHIHNTKESIEKKLPNFYKRMSALEEGVPSLCIPDLVESDLELFEDLKKLSTEYLGFIKKLYSSLLVYCQDLDLPEQSGYGYYIRFKNLNKERISKVQRELRYELPKRYTELVKKYRKCYNEIISKLEDSSLKSTIIDLLNPEVYKFAQELVELRVDQFYSIAKLAKFKQNLIDVQYRLGEESLEEIIENLRQKELTEDRMPPQDSMSDAIVMQELQGRKLQ